MSPLNSHPFCLCWLQGREGLFHLGRDSLRSRVTTWGGGEGQAIRSFWQPQNRQTEDRFLPASKALANCPLFCVTPPGNRTILASESVFSEVPPALLGPLRATGRTSPLPFLQPHGSWWGSRLSSCSGTEQRAAPPPQLPATFPLPSIAFSIQEHLLHNDKPFSFSSGNCSSHFSTARKRRGRRMENWSSFGGRCQMGGAEDNWAVSLSQEGKP